MIVANIVPLALVILMNCMVCNFGKAVAAFKPISTTSSNTRAVTSLLRVSQYEHCLRTDRRLALFRLFSSTIENPPVESVVPLVLAEGLFAVDKPLEWTSQDVVSFIRGILERDCRSRGAIPGKVGKANSIKVGHGGTLDPLATGVLVIGVGSGTKELTTYLSGSKAYRARGKFGFETTTLDMEGDVTKTASFDHISRTELDKILPEFLGKTQQIPPIFSAIKKNGKALYKSGRKGKTAEDIKIEPREVQIHNIELTDFNLPEFELNVECGGGTYIRSLVRDIGCKVDSVATTTLLERTKQGCFQSKDCLPKDDWTAENIYSAIDRFNRARG